MKIFKKNYSGKKIQEVNVDAAAFCYFKKTRVVCLGSRPTDTAHGQIVVMDLDNGSPKLTTELCFTRAKDYPIVMRWSPPGELHVLTRLGFFILVKLRSSI